MCRPSFLCSSYIINIVFWRLCGITLFALNITLIISLLCDAITEECFKCYSCTNYDEDTGERITYYLYRNLEYKCWYIGPEQNGLSSYMYWYNQSDTPYVSNSTVSTCAVKAHNGDMWLDDVIIITALWKISDCEL